MGNTKRPLASLKMKLPLSNGVIKGAISALYMSCSIDLTPASDASCAGRGDLSERRCDHSQGTGTALHPCASDSDGSAHRSGQTSTYSLPTCTYKAFLLKGHTKR